MRPHQWTIYLAASFLAGNLLASRIPLDAVLCLVLALLVLTVLAVYYYSAGVRIVCVGLCLLFLGLFSFSYAHANWVLHLGRVELGEQSARLEVIDISAASLVQSQLLVQDLGKGLRYQLTLWDPPSLSIGDVFRAKIKISASADTNYYAAHGIHARGDIRKIEAYEIPHASLRRALGILRLDLEELISRTVSPDTRALVSGLLLGVRASFDDSFKLQMARSGTTHIVALSGFNITLIIILLTSLGKMLPKRLRLVGSGLIILGFIIMTGLSASVVRAAVMGWLLLLSGIWGRQIHLGAALLVAAVSMVAINPFILEYDIGFQLSVLATAGLITLGGPLSSLLAKPLIKLPDIAREAVLSTSAATLATVPVTMSYFGGVSTVSLFANLTIIPLVPVAMLTSAIGIGLAAATVWAAPVLFLFWLPVRLLSLLIKFWGSLPVAYVSIHHVSPLFIIGWYSVLSLFTIKHAHLTPYAMAPSARSTDHRRHDISLPNITPQG